MTKENLLAALRPFLEEGYLQEYHEGDSFLLFQFLKAGYVGFLCDPEDTSPEPVGALFSQCEAQVVIRSQCRSIFPYLKDETENRLVFSEALLEKCRSFFRRSRLKRMIRKFFPPMDCPATMPDRFSTFLGLTILTSSYAFKKKTNQDYRKHRRGLQFFATIAIASFALVMLYLLTFQWQKQFREERASVPFDKHTTGSAYSYAEADRFVPLADRTTTGADLSAGSAKTTYYYLWYNTQTQAHGLVVFRPDCYDLPFEDYLGEKGILPAPIRLYGTPESIPAGIAALLTDAETDESVAQPSFGQPITLPDGSVIAIPEQPLPTVPEIAIPGMPQITDHSEEAAAWFAKLGLSLEQLELGERYLYANTQPERINSTINQVLNTTFAVLMLLLLVAGVPLIVYAYKMEADLSRIGNAILYACQRYQPVFAETEIHVWTDAVIALYAFCRKLEYASGEILKFLVAIPLQEAAPVIRLYEDGKLAAAVKLEAEGELTGKYFLAFLQIPLLNTPGVSLVNVEGYVSDAVTDYAPGAMDTVYQMKGQLLASECFPE